MRLRRLTSLGLALVIGGCASRTPSSGSPSPSRDRNVINITELQEGMASGLGNLYDLIQRSHPEWFRGQLVGVQARRELPQVWMDRQRLGDPTTLRTVPISAATRVRFLTPSEAQSELGLNNLGGAILVSTR
jgi:hypothetical protein